jgi:hypothetical protein
MDIFGFFQHFQWKFLIFSKFSDYIPFSKDGNPRRFEVFRLNFHCKGWKSLTFRSFRLNFHCKGWKSTTFRRFPIIFIFSKYGNPRRFQVFRFYSLFKGCESPKLRAKKNMSEKVLIQFYCAHTKKETTKFFISFFIL